MTAPNNAQIDTPLLPPGEIPEKFLTGSIIVCEKVSREAQSNNISIIGAFTGANIAYKTNNPLEMLAKTTQIPMAPFQVFARIFSNGHQIINWKIFARVLSFNGIPQKDCGFLTSEGSIPLSNTGINQGDIYLSFPGTGINLTPERKASIKADGQITIVISIELWTTQTTQTAQTFLVAQTLKLCYNPDQETPHVNVADPATRGAK